MTEEQKGFQTHLDQFNEFKEKLDTELKSRKLSKGLYEEFVCEVEEEAATYDPKEEFRKMFSFELAI